MICLELFLDYMFGRRQIFGRMEQHQELPVMSVIANALALLPTIPIDHLVILVALSGLALAAFAVYAVHSIAKGRQS